MQDFDSTLPMILNRTLDAIMPDYRELFARHDLTEQQWRVLRLLWSEQRVTSAELSRRALLPAPSLVGIIDRLEKKGLVNRVRSVEDRRAIYIVATAAGRAIKKDVAPRVAEIDQRLRGCVSEAEWEMMSGVLEKIALGLTAQDLPLAEKA